MRDSQHQVKYVETFRGKVVELGGMNILEAKMTVVAALAAMEQAKQDRVGNLTRYLACLDWEVDRELIRQVRAEIESELGLTP